MRQDKKDNGWVGRDTAGGAAVLGALGAALLGWVSTACWQRVVGAVGQDAWSASIEVAQGLEIIVLAAAGLVSAWLSVLLLAGSAAALPGARLAPLRSFTTRLAPRLVPRITAGLVTTAVVLTPAGVAHAAPETGWGATQSVSASGGPGTRTALVTLAGAGTPGTEAPGTKATGTDAPAAGAPEPGWRPTEPPRTAPSSTSIDLVSRGTAAPDSIVVRAGDTLWDITARHLGADADAPTIAAAWPLWFEANRDVIGADPDLILPGTLLVPPPHDLLAAAATPLEQVAP
ncbi:LysM peptidoglycan-binding domain-containing protein [Ornithinimicrobium cryptoxanthini]|uniref:LysM domain-containing protein n=1 Tax=Ornithinimicrobium cryptoxanthini TaxID=2934161 RepID=A0ABY4YEX8_9MICO|nr:hypothetical protein [Ornithinimicrobium cryptoxanthini]USQ75278.1 hypothetical protein NF557_11665 [Ornithinimicrobium cryptoxanthini]